LTTPPANPLQWPITGSFEDEKAAVIRSLAPFCVRPRWKTSDDIAAWLPDSLGRQKLESLLSEVLTATHRDWRWVIILAQFINNHRTTYREPLWRLAGLLLSTADTLYVVASTTDHNTVEKLLSIPDSQSAYLLAWFIRQGVGAHLNRPEATQLANRL